MKEDFLHYLWRFGKFNKENLCTSHGEDILVYAVGEYNMNSGPDFFNSRLLIGDQLWAGNVEIHLKSSDWYLHGHEKDLRYNNVILHVVWEHDVEVFRTDNSIIPTLELQNFAEKAFFRSYSNFITQRKSFINCEKSIEMIDDFLINHWKDQLFTERLEKKTTLILKELEITHNDWEAVLFKMLLKNFGLKVNGESFYQISNLADFQIVKKVRHEPEVLESLFLGCAGLLEDKGDGEYYFEILQSHFNYLCKKHKSLAVSTLKPAFFRLRPANFPTIRLSQMAQLYHKHGALFNLLMAANSLQEIYDVFKVGVSDYWKTHYTWGKKSAKSEKKLTKRFIDLLIINTVIPLKFCYYKYLGIDNNPVINEIISSLPSEKNSIIERFRKLGVHIECAMDSQAVLQLYNAYCQSNKCLDCAIGNRLLNK